MKHGRSQTGARPCMDGVADQPCVASGSASATKPPGLSNQGDSQISGHWVTRFASKPLRVCRSPSASLANRSGGDAVRALTRPQTCHVGTPLTDTAPPIRPHAHCQTSTPDSVPGTFHPPQPADRHSAQASVRPLIAHALPFPRPPRTDQSPASLPRPVRTPAHVATRPRQQHVDPLLALGHLILQPLGTHHSRRPLALKLDLHTRHTQTHMTRVAHVTRQRLTRCFDVRPERPTRDLGVALTGHDALSRHPARLHAIAS